MSLIAAIYARFSTDNQKDSSIDDQLRRCRAVAERYGYVVPPEYIFSDAAISGSVSAEGRPGYAELMEGWRAGRFSAVIVDNQSRLFRDEEEGASVKKLVKRTGMRVLAHSGVDTASAGWELVWSFNSMLDAKYRADVADMVVRGMDGQLERGFMVSPPPYGYRRQPEYSSAGDHVGTRFVIDPAEAAVVRRIFAERIAGKAYSKIAGGLIADAIPAAQGGAWTVSSVVNVLKNRLYAGVFSANDSATTRWRASKGTPVGPLARRDYLRPELELVSLADFEAVQPGRSTAVRGGGKNWAAGLCKCGVCGGKLSVKATDKSASLWCSACAKRSALGVSDAGVPYYSADAVRAALTFALQTVLSSAAMQVFKDKLEVLRSGGPRAQLEVARAKLAASSKALERLAKSLALIDDDDVRASFKSDVEAASDAKRAAKLEVEKLEAGLSAMNSSVLESQLAIDPRALVPLLFGKIPPAELRAVLRRLFPSIVLSRAVGHKRFCDIVITQSVSACAAVLTGTPEVVVEPVVRRFRVFTSSRNNVPPVVQLLDESGAVVAATDAQRRCSCCEAVKPSDEFGWQNRELQRRHSRCRACASAYYKAWRAKAVDQGLDATKAWRAKDLAQKKLVGAVNKADVVAIL